MSYDYDVTMTCAGFWSDYKLQKDTLYPAFMNEQCNVFVRIWEKNDKVVKRFHWIIATQVIKTLELTSIWHQSDMKVSDWCQIKVNI